MEWQPIETAPKDGTEIIAYSTTRFDYELTKYLRDVDGRESVFSCVQIISWNDEEMKWDQTKIGVPTHWMHLPLPPSD